MAKRHPANDRPVAGASAARVGPYLLDHPVGRGGMGRVWRGRHVRTGHVVAIKVLDAPRVELAVARDAFRREVRAQARLDHPGIVRVHDQGVVRGEEASPELAVGSPWLAMELAPHGSLDAWPEPLTWSGVRGVLLAVLDALAHAHARSVVHRDLKAANLLVFRRPTEPGGAPGVRISDFGVAHAFRGVADGLPRSGTPRAMAPEQFRGVLADQGPWTDLYAVGCLAWELVVGEPPFPGRDPAALRTAHLTHEPRPLPADVVAPSGLGGWLERCLAKSTEGRFQFAADAAYALVALGDAPGEGRVRARVPSSAETLPVEDGPASTLAWALEDGGAPAALPAAPRQDDARVAPAPFPQRWRRPRMLRPPAPGAGLGLFGLHTPPLVGRAKVRDAAWTALAGVRDTGRPAAVVIDGPPGVGKSRIADWVGERFHEVGGGPVARVSCALGTADDALERLVARQLGVELADPADAWDRVRAVSVRLGLYAPWEAEAIGRLLQVGPAADAGFRSPEERWAIAARVLGRLAGPRALLVIADDAHWSDDLLAFTRWALARPGGDRLALAFVFTVRSDIAGAGGGGERSDSSVSGPAGPRGLFDSVVQHPRCTLVQVGPLSPGEHGTLVRSLGVAPALAALIAERTAGNPLFAVQLVSDLVRSGQVVASPEGLALRGGVSSPLPADLGAVWSARIRRLVRGRPPGVGEALVLAALLGVEVDRATWASACARAGLPVPDALVEDLVAERIWLPRAWGWLFAHALMREGLLRRLDAASTSRLHRICAAAVGQVEAGRPSTSERIGRHLLAAGDAEAAITPLLEGARRRFARGELDAALSVLRRARRALERGAPADAQRQAEVALLAGRVYQARGRSRDALAEVRRVRRGAGEHAPTLAAAALLEGQVVRQQGELLRARTLFLEALDLASRCDAHAARGDALLALSRVALQQGHVAEAEALAEQALEQAGDAGHATRVSAALRALSAVRRQLGDIDGAVERAERALALSRRGGDRLGEAGAHVALGLAAESGDEPGVSLAFFQRAAELYDAVDAPAGHSARLHAARVLIDVGARDEASELLDGCASAFAALGRRGRLGVVDVVRLRLDAHERDWTAWRLHIRRASRLLGATGIVEPDLGVALELAADAAHGVGEPERAAEALELAALLWGARGGAGRAAGGGAAGVPGGSGSG